MVTILYLLIVLNVFQQDAPTFEELFPKTPPPDIVNVRKVSESENILKPCHPFTVIFEVTLAGEALRTQWPKIARKVSNMVRVNGNEYRNRLSDSSGGANDACRFELLWPEPFVVGGDPPPRSADSALIAATCQFDLKEQACLFREPGDYHLEFFLGDEVIKSRVYVGMPTFAEQAVIGRLSTMPMFALLLDPTDRQYATPENIEICEELLARPSDYSTMLSMTAGVAKGKRVGRAPWTGLTDDQKREELEERYRLLEPVANQERLTSRLVGLAAFELANVAGQLARLEAEGPKHAEYTALQERLFRRVADCALVPREQSLAKQVILQLDSEGE